MATTTQPSAIGSGPKAPRSRRKIIIVSAVILVLLGMIITMLVLLMNQRSTNKVDTSKGQNVTAQEVCSSSIIRSASGPLDSGDQVLLGEVVDKVTALKDYERDPNCLYIVLQYKIAVSDAPASQDLLAKLEKVYSPGIGFSTSFATGVASIETLRKNVNFLVESNKQTEENAKKQDETTSQGSQKADQMFKEQQ